MKITQMKTKLPMLCLFLVSVFSVFALSLANPLKAEASWTLHTLDGTPNNGWASWGKNGYAIINRGDGNSYLYIYGKHYTSKSNARPSLYRLHMMKWNTSSNEFEEDSILSTGTYNNYRDRFYSTPYHNLADFERGVYSFEHEARIGGHYHRDSISRNVTFSNYMTVGGGKNGKVALLYFDKKKNNSDKNANTSKLRIRNANNRNKTQSVSVDTSKGITLDIRASMTASDGGADTTDNNNGSLEAFANNEWHIKNNHDVNKASSTIFLKKRSGSDVYSTYGGVEYSNRNDKYRYGKRNLNIPIRTLKSLDNGFYDFDLEIGLNSGGAASKSIVRDRLSTNFGGKTIHITHNDGSRREIYVYRNSAGNLSLRVRDAHGPTGDLSQTPTSWTKKNVTLKVSNIQDKGGSGYYRTRLPNGSYTTSKTPSYTATSNGSYEFILYDHEGNHRTLTQTVSNIDKTNPTATISQTPSSWTSNAVTVKLSNIRDDRSGYYRTRLPNGNYTTSTSPSQSVSSNGTYTFVVYDRAGNSQNYSVSVSNIDKVKPTITFSPKGSAVYEQAHTTKVSINDAGSGVSHQEYRWTESSSQPTSGWKNFSNGATIQTPNSTGKYYLWVKAIDKVGNERIQRSNLFSVDQTKPKATFSLSKTSWVNEPIQIQVRNAKDTHSGYNQIKQPDGSFNTSGSFDYTVKENGTYSFVVYDKAGNHKTYTIEVKNMDTEPPSLEIKDVGHSTQQVDVRLFYSDD